jgi:hypothetical protein
LSTEGVGLTPARLALDMDEANERFDVVRSSPTTLLLDLDTPEAIEQFYRVLPKVAEHFGVERREEWKSKSGKQHVRVFLDAPQPLAVRLALQAALGSDGIREVLSLKRMANGCEEPSLLFRPRTDWGAA